VRDCWAHSQLVHEIGHVIGLVHEHQRSDRDQFVKIHFENVLPDFVSAFQLLTVGTKTIYDFKSIMHYWDRSYTSNGGLVIEALPPYTGLQPLMGMSEDPTELDLQEVAETYRAAGPGVGPSAPTCGLAASGGTLSPFAPGIQWFATGRDAQHYAISASQDGLKAQWIGTNQPDGASGAVPIDPVPLQYWDGEMRDFVTPMADLVYPPADASLKGRYTRKIQLVDPASHRVVCTTNELVIIFY
jgi:hypothetical protein